MKAGSPIKSNGPAFSVMHILIGNREPPKSCQSEDLWCYPQPPFQHFLPETVILHFCPTVQPFKRKSIIFVSSCAKTFPKSTKKDTFHNLFFVLTKEHLSDCIFCATKGGGGWRKTFKVFLIKILSPRQKFGSVPLSDPIRTF
jgi:hypothetical protein